VTCDNAVDYVYGVELAEINPYNIYGLNCNPPATTNRPAFIKVPKTYLEGLFIILLDMKRGLKHLISRTGKGAEI
jgi:hypothetical protein